MLGTPELQLTAPEIVNDTDDLFENTMRQKYGVRYSDNSKKGLCFTD